MIPASQEAAGSRVFFGFMPTLHHIRILARYQHRLYTHFPVNVRNEFIWTPPASFALPVRYLGAVEDEYLDFLKMEISQILPQGPITLEPGAMQPLFTSEGRPTLFYLPFSDPSGRVDRLADALEEILEDTGFPFRPAHRRFGVLLARVPADLSEGILSYIESFSVQDTKPLVMKRLALASINDYNEGVKPIYLFDMEEDSDGQTE